MKIAVVGSSGYIAGFLLEKLKSESFVENILKIGRTDTADEHLDLCASDKFQYSLLDEVDFVVFTAAVSSPDKCAVEYDASWQINVRGTECFIQNALERGCKVLFFSSDAVFGDIPGYIYEEESETKPETAYGRMKKAIEDRFIGNNSFKAIRLPYVVSAKDRFVSYCLKCIRDGETADVFHPFYRNCISVTDVVNVVIWFMKNWDVYKPSVLNVAGKELVSRIRIADELNRCLGQRLKYIVSIPEASFYKNRPQITQMKSAYLQEYNILADDSFSEKIKMELEEADI